MLRANIIYDNSNNSYTVLYLIKSYKLASAGYIINNKNEIMTLSTHGHTQAHAEVAAAASNFSYVLCSLNTWC